MFLPNHVLEEKLRRFLEEDMGQGDITTSLTIPENTSVEAIVVAKEGGIVAGTEVASTLCQSVNLQIKVLKANGVQVEPGTLIMRVSGDARTLLSIERTLLNMLSRMSGIATLTNRLVRKVTAAGYKKRVACTRKVAPGLGYFDKKAVFIGDGDTHRLHLDDLILIKDNHIRIVGDITKTVKKTRQASFSKKIEVEVASPKAALQAAKAGADIIMLDNFSPAMIKKAVHLLTVERVRNKVLLEASGRITEENITEYAATDVDILSVGEITHSAKTLDMNLKVVKIRSV